MDAVDKILDEILLLAQEAKANDWSIDKLTKKMVKLYEREKGAIADQPNRKIVVKRMQHFGGEGIFRNISEVLQKSKKGDIIVMACGVYKIFETYDSYHQYMVSLWDKDDISHFQIIPSDEIQNFVIICDNDDPDHLNVIRTKLIAHFKGIQKDHVVFIPLDEDKICIVVKSLSGTYHHGRERMEDFISGIDDASVRKSVQCPATQLDRKVDKSYLMMQLVKKIIEVSKSPSCAAGIQFKEVEVDKCEPVSITINIIQQIGDHNTNYAACKIEKKQTRREKYIQWIEDNPPRQRTVTQHYNKFVIDNGDKYSSAQFSSLMEEMNYIKAKKQKGTIWIKSEESDEEVDD